MEEKGIYAAMKNDWQTYCLMSAVIYIEEMKKPTRDIQLKKWKNHTYTCLCFHGVRLKMKGKEILDMYFQITRDWEKKVGKTFIGKSYLIPKLEKSGQYYFYLTPIWLNEIVAECGNIPNEYSMNTAIDRINHMKRFPKKTVDTSIALFETLLFDKKTAAGAFIVSMDYECRGIQSGAVALCMSEKYSDFLQFMLKVASRWGWATQERLSTVSVNYSKNLGINASPQSEFRINIKGLREIFDLAGPLADPLKNKCVQFNVTRSANYKTAGSKLKDKTREKIYQAVMTAKGITTTDLQFLAEVRTDVILDHLHSLKKQGLIDCKRNGKRYIWSDRP